MRADAPVTPRNGIPAVLDTPLQLADSVGLPFQRSVSVCLAVSRPVESYTPFCGKRLPKLVVCMAELQRVLSQNAAETQRNNDLAAQGAVAELTQQGPPPTRYVSKPISMNNKQRAAYLFQSRAA